MAVLITGGSGFLGSVLTEKLLARGYKLYSLSRHPPIGSKKLIPLVGDIKEENLGLDTVPRDIQAVYHLAAIHRLSEDKDGSIWKTNVEGTKRVLAFCAEHDIPHLYFCSTAFTLGRNPYEESKATCELLIRKSDIPRKTIFKPSIIMGTEKYPYPGHFSQFISLIIKIHQRAELIRRKIEGTLRLPILEPVFRIRGNENGTLNMITVESVAEAMAKTKKEGICWLTHPHPPTLGQLVEWVDEFVMVHIKVLPDFKPTPIEAQFQKMSAAFQPYLQGNSFKSDLKECPPINKEFIRDTLKRTILD